MCKTRTVNAEHKCYENWTFFTNQDTTYATKNECNEDHKEKDEFSSGVTECTMKCKDCPCKDGKKNGIICVYW